MKTHKVSTVLLCGLHCMLAILVVVMCLSDASNNQPTFWITVALFVLLDTFLLFYMLQEKVSSLTEKILLLLVDCLWLILLLQTPTAAWLAFPLFFLQFIVYGQVYGWLPTLFMLLAISYVYSHNPEFQLPASIIGPIIGALVSYGLTRAYIYVVAENRIKQELISNLQNMQLYIEQTDHTLALEQERSKLAADIHDTVAQGLTSINLILSAAQQQLLSNPQKTGELIDLAAQTAQHNLVEVRHFITNLAVPDQPKDFYTSLQGLIDSIPHEDLTFSLTSEGDPWLLSATQQQNLLHLVRSSLSNTIRHAQATHAEIALTYTSETLSVEIKDNGIGFTPEVTQGRGLFFAQERLFTLQGSLKVDSSPREGTTISATIPRKTL